jgi:hypothetical protein
MPHGFQRMMTHFSGQRDPVLAELNHMPNHVSQRFQRNESSLR